MLIHRQIAVLVLAACGLFGPAASGVQGATFSVSSPGAGLSATITFDEAAGAVSYSVTSGGTVVIGTSPLGLTTSLADFTTGIAFVGSSTATVDETYTLPVGKRSTYVNRANELQLRFSKSSRELQIHFRAYDDGIAFRYHLPGTGSVSISREGTAFRPPAGVTYYGMEHPNRWGYESNLRKLVTDTSFSVPVLVEAPASGHWLFIGQAATYGTYVIPWLQLDGGLLRVRFPLDQAAQGPVATSLPFRSPWRVVLVSPGTLARIVESTMMENLNPPTDSVLVGASWIRPGRASWDYINKLYDQIPTWIDFDAEMGWQFHVMEGGWEGRYSGQVDDYAAYAASRGTGLIGWTSARSNNTAAKANSTFSRFNTLGVKGAKVDFFDRNYLTGTGTVTDDYEDTQASLQQRDAIAISARDRQILLVYHGCAIPSGERRRWPHLLGLEAINGLEHHPASSHDVTIPYIRNVMGPVDYTPIDAPSTFKTQAGQVATAVVFETGLQIYAPSYAYFRSSVAYEFFRQVPCTWDETRFVEGYPESHATIARRKGAVWYVGSINNLARTATIPLSFLSDGTSYTAEIYRDGGSIAEIVRETQGVTRSSVLRFDLMPSGGVAQRLVPEGTPRPTPTPTPTPPGAFTEITPGAAGVTASTNDGNLPGNTVDGSLATRWSGNGDGAWIQYDLGSARTLAFVRIAVYNGHSRQNRFDLRVSNDLAGPWQDVIAGGLTSGSTTQEQTHDFADVDARYVRYVGHGSTVGTFNSLTEVSLFTPTGTTPTPTPTPPTPTPVLTPTPTPTAAPACVTATGGGAWQSRAFTGQSGTFTVQFDALPSGTASNAVVGLSLGPQTAHAGFAGMVTFSSSGNILARNGGAYTAQTTVPWSAGTSYRFRLVLNVPAHTYSIFVRAAGGAEQTIGAGYAFRTEQAAVTSLNNYGVFVGTGTGSLQVCGFALTP